LRYNKNPKDIKKLVKIAGIIALCIMALPAGAWLLVRSPSVQTYLTRQIASKISENLNAKFEVGKVDIAFFNRLILRDIYIEDQQRDTLLKADAVYVSINSLSRSKRKIVFNRIQIQKAKINLRSDADSVINFKFIADALRSDDSTRNSWEFAIHGIHLRESRLTYRKHNIRQRESGINFDDIEISNLNLLANKINTTTDSVHFNLSFLNLTEKSGFSINHMSSLISFSPTAINLNGLQLVTPVTRLNSDHFDLKFNDYRAFRDFVNLVSIDSYFRPSSIHSLDIAYFAPRLQNIDVVAEFSGEISGRINNLKGENLSINGFKETSLLADITLVGLPDFKETFIFLDLQEFTSSVDDIKTASRKDLSQLNNLGKINYKGKFTGFIDDFVAFGELNTDLGALVTDLSLQPGSGNLLNFNGQLRAVQFDAGSLTGSDQIGKISFNAGLKGHTSPQSGIYADLEGIIDSVFIFGYNYRQVELSGDLADKKFEGSASIDDPNLMMQFIGSIDLSEDIPVFDFSANVSGARLYDLNLNKEEPSLTISFFTTANFRGNNIDNLSGKISLVNAMFEKEDELFEIGVASVEATGAGEQRQLTLNSSIADAGISGKYEFSTIARTIRHYIHNYIPSYSANNHSINANGNKFSFFFHLKETSGFTGFFAPSISLATGTILEGTYDPAAFRTDIKGHSDEFRFKNNLFKNINLVSVSNDSVFSLQTDIYNATIGNRFEIDNIELRSRIINDSIHFTTDWDNKESILYKGNLSAFVNFEEIPGKQIPLVDITILPSQIIIADSLWHIDQSRIIIDSSSYHIDNFLFGREGQSLKFNGAISHNNRDSLHMEFNNMDLSNIELITELTKFNLSGIISGEASLADVYYNPVFKTDLEVNSLRLNNQDYGDLSIISQWDNLARTITIHTFSDRDSDRIINIAGSYMPDGGILDFDIKLDKINIRTFDGYLDVVFGDLRGLASGELKLEGNIREPVFNGNLLLQKASFTIDYLKTQYNFTHNLKIANNDIFFNDLVIYDVNHNVCRTTGSVTSTFFRDFALNIYLYPDRFMALNTTARDNELFYGRVLTTGIVHILGPVNNLLMNISARTNRNTQFFIPLQKSSEIGDLHFLNFTSNSRLNPEEDELQESDRRINDVNLSGIQLNFDLDVTPEAEVQIIFDSRIGDIIRGRGNGSFKMEINTLGQFNMFGEYTIEQGQYLFTLQNVINKRLDIESGSRISWNGDPFDANVDLIAAYRLRAPLRPLSPIHFIEDIYARRIPIDCKIIMKNKLMTPDISFNIELPTADTDTRRKVEGILNTEDSRNRQFLSLLVIHNFMPDQGMGGSGMGNTLGMSATEASITTVSEFFSNQLSNWLSQLSRDVDFGINWRPGDDITPDEVELALSTQMFNDRVTINGHVDVGGRHTNTSNIVGDFDVDIKLNRSGKLRLRAFTRANDNLIRNYLSQYTQGVGLFYREEFDDFDELMNRYWNRIFNNTNEKELDQD
jgi:hypothetical protein